MQNASGKERQISLHTNRPVSTLEELFLYGLLNQF